MTGPLLGIAADDLTGACDTAAQLTGFGFSVVCAADPDGPMPDASGYDAIAVNTQSRRMSGGEAAEAVRRGVGRLREAGARIVFKKIDTALRGNIAEEVSAAMGEVFSSAVLVAAIPRIGRTTREGRQFYLGRPLEETALGEDDINPTPFFTSRIEELFAGMPGVRTRVVGVERVRDPGFSLGGPAAGSGRGNIFIFDAETGEDIDLIAGAALGHEGGRLLFVGSLGLMESMAGILKERRTVRAEAKVVPGASRILVACGSSHPASRVQIERLLESGIGQAAAVSGGDFTAGKVPPAAGTGVVHCLHIGPGVRREFPDMNPGEAFSRLVRDTVEKGGYDCLLVIGGETSFDVLRKLRIPALEVVESFSTVAAISLPLGGAPAGPSLVVTKGGSVGEPDILVRLVNKLLKRKLNHGT